MSSDISEYSLRSGIFTTCGGVWNDETDSYEKTTISDIAKCCLDDCKEPVEFCEKYCIENSGPGKLYDTQEKLDDCMATCHTYRRLCNDICQLSSPYFNEQSYYLECAKEKGCLNSLRQTNSECIKANSDEILKCCLHDCIPAEDLDCNKYCLFSHNIAMNKDKLLQSKNRPMMTQKKSGPGTGFTIIMGFLIGIILFFLIRKIIRK